MFIETLTLISFVSSLLLLIVVSIYSYLLHKKENKFEDIEIKAYKQAKDILQQAHEKSEHILDKTLEKSKDMLLKTELFKEYLEKDLKKTLNATISEYTHTLKDNSKEITNSYTDLFRTFKEHYLQETSKLIKEMTSLGEKGLSDSSNVLKQELINSQRDFNKKIEQELQVAKKEIEEYKKTEFEKINKSLEKTLIKLSEELLGKIIPLDDHEKLIFNALEKAKKEGVLNP